MPLGMSDDFMILPFVFVLSVSLLFIFSRFISHCIVYVRRT